MRGCDAVGLAVHRHLTDRIAASLTRQLLHDRVHNAKPTAYTKSVGADEPCEAAMRWVWQYIVT